MLFGLVLAGVFAAIMSTADSQLLVAASSVVRDLYERLLGRDRRLSQRQLVRYSRAVVVALVVIALLLGSVAETVVFWLVLFSWAGLGAALGPTSILALYWKRTTRAGVAAGMITAGVVMIWRLVPALKAMLYELVPGFIAGLRATVAASLITRPPEQGGAMVDAMGTDSGAQAR